MTTRSDSSPMKISFASMQFFILMIVSVVTLSSAVHEMLPRNDNLAGSYEYDTYQGGATSSSKLPLTSDHYGLDFVVKTRSSDDPFMEYSVTTKEALAVDEMENANAPFDHLPSDVSHLSTALPENSRYHALNQEIFPSDETTASNKENISLTIKANKRMNDKKQYNHKFKYDPALILMGLGKRTKQSDKSSDYQELSKLDSSYDPTLMYTRLGKRGYNYDPAFKFVGLDKRDFAYDPSFKYMGLGKRDFNYDPALKYMGLGKKSFNYDPALKYMGLGKRGFSYDPALKYMGLGKRGSSYDPALKYIGISKRNFSYDPALKYMGLGKRQSSYDPALKYMGLGKRQSSYDPALKYMGLGKRQSSYDPALKYMGLGKREFSYDPALKYMGLGKRGYNYDPALKYMGLGKRDFRYDPALKYMGLGKREINKDPSLITTENDNLRSEPEEHITLNNNHTSINGSLKRSFKYDPAITYMGLGKREFSYDPALKYMGLGKREFSYDPALKYMGLGKRESSYVPTMKYMRLGKQDYYDDSPSKGTNINKRFYKFDPALEYMGLGKRDFYGDFSFKGTDINKRRSKFDPALRFMGLGKRPEKIGKETLGLGKRPFKFDPALKFMGLGKRNERYPFSHSLHKEMEDPSLYTKVLSTHEGVSQTRHKTPNVTNVSSKSSVNDNAPLLNFGDLEKERLENEIAINALDKRADKYDPFLKYMGLGKRESKEQPDFMTVKKKSVLKLTSKSRNCEKYCHLNKRNKREIKDKMFNDITSPTLQLQNYLENLVMNESLLEELAANHFQNRIEGEKRDRDNRPKYNPGWIFIGLGKRGIISKEQTDPVFNIVEPDQQNYRVPVLDEPEYLLSKYYEFLDNVKDKIQKIKNRINNHSHSQS
ncbi:hypothetical protein X975_02429, partial [Stegodyphus mimosarum]